MYYLELTSEEGAFLVRILTNKAKEIHTWRCATGSTVRDEEHDKVAALLKRITSVKGDS